MNLKRKIALSGGKVVATGKAPRLHDGAFDEDVCMEILLRLPIKSVIKFQTVCKQWLSLISSDHFRRLHTLRHHQPPPCVILKTPEQRLCHFNLIRKPTMLIPFSSINIPCRYSKIFSSSNGLVILYRCNDNYFHVYNPITKQSRKICFVSLTDSSSYCVRMLHLVFDPSKSLHYKVVCIWGPSGAPFSDRKYYKMEVFDSEKGTWKAAGMDAISVSSILLFFNNTYCKNNIYGMNYTRDGYRSLYCIDIDKNVVRFLTNPSVGMPGRIAFGDSIQEWNGCLYYSALIRSLHSGHSAFVWELEDDKWSLKHEDRLPFLVQWSYVLRFIPQTSTLLIQVVPPRNIIAYSFLEKTCSELLRLPIECELKSINVFHQTLSPV